MKFDSIIFGVLMTAMRVVQAVPVPTHSTDVNASNDQHYENNFKTDQSGGFPEELKEKWNCTVNVCRRGPAPQPGTAEYETYLKAALREFKATEQGASPLIKRERDQDRERREMEFRERRERAERERREKEDRERREREDKERREREERERREREQNNRDKDGKATNVCTHDDWKNNRPCAQP